MCSAAGATDFPGDGGRLQLWKGAGCRACHNSGYRGRFGIYELLVTSDVTREMIQQRANANMIRAEALKMGMITLRQDGWRKVLKGVTTIEEVARVTKGDIIAEQRGE